MKKGEDENIDILKNYKIFKEVNVTLNDYAKLVKFIIGENIVEKLQGLVGLNKLCNLEKTKNNSLSHFNVLIPRLIVFIDKKYMIEYVYEALSSLIIIEKLNLKKNNEIKSKIDEKIIENLIFFLLKSENQNINKTILKYLDLIMTNENYRKIFLQEKKLDILLDIIKEENCDLYTVKKCLKIISKFFSFVKKENDLIFSSIDIMKYTEIIINITLKYSNITLIVKYSTFIIAILMETNKQNNIIEELINTKSIPKILEFIEKDEDDDTLYHCLRIISNIVMNENNDYTQEIINSDALEILKKTLNEDYDNINIKIREESSLLISNIAAGTQEQITKLIESNYYQILYNIIKNEEESKVKANCLWAIYNFSLLKNEQYLLNIIHQGYIKLIKDRLSIDHGELLACGLEALETIIIFGEKNCSADTKIVENEILNLNIIENLKFLKNTSSEEIVLLKINKILEKYPETQNIQNNPIYQ